MNKLYIGGVVVLVAAASVLWLATSAQSDTTPTQSTPKEKIYVALEEEGAVAVINAANNQVLQKIDLAEHKGGGTVAYMAHNVQVAPDGSSVVVTANVNDEHMEMGDNAESGMDMATGLPDQVIVIDPKTDSITKRIPIEQESHLAHVVYEQDNKSVLVTLQETGQVYRVDLSSGQILRKTDLGSSSGPHGLRMTPDGSRAYIALLSGKGVAVLNSATGEAEMLKLPGAAVQTAVTPDGAYAFASLYDTKQVAWFDLKTGGRGLVDLPPGSRGPVQLYPSPDSRHLYVADQGYYFDQPTGSMIYRIDLARKMVDATIAGGAAPHGIVVSQDGTRAYVTNLVGNDVSVIDTATGKEIARIPVGHMPNGVSIWSAELGGTP